MQKSAFFPRIRKKGDRTAYAERISLLILYGVIEFERGIVFFQMTGDVFFRDGCKIRESLILQLKGKDTFGSGIDGVSHGGKYRSG